MDDPRKIAKFLTEDPDVFNELSSGGVAGGIGASFFGGGDISATPRSRKRKRIADDEAEPGPKRTKRFTVNPVTGKPEVRRGSKTEEGGEVLYSDTQTEDPETPLEEAKKQKYSELKKLLKLSQQKVYHLDRKYEEGLPLPDQKVLTIDRGLAKAYSRVHSISEALKNYLGKRGIGTECALSNYFSQYSRRTKLMSTSPGEMGREYKRSRTDQPRPLEDIPRLKEGAKIPSPPKGWQGVEVWGADDKRDYFRRFFYEVCTIYLEGIEDLLKDHQRDCKTGSKCRARNHLSIIIRLHCKKGQHDLAHAWDKHRTNRSVAIEQFKRRLKGQKGKAPAETPFISVPTSPETKRRAAELEEKGLSGSTTMSMKEKFPHLFTPEYMKSLPTRQQVNSAIKARKARRMGGRSRLSPFELGFTPPEEFESGEMVRHPHYGKGKVYRLSPESQDTVWVVFGGGVLQKGKNLIEVPKSEL